MLYDLFFQLGGDNLVSLMASIIGPIFDAICTNATAFGGSWEALATIFERLIS